MPEEKVTPKSEDKYADKSILAEDFAMGELLLEEEVKLSEKEKLEASKPKETPAPEKKEEQVVAKPVVEKEPDWMPEKFRGKSKEDIAKAFLEAERAKTKAEQETAELKKLHETKPVERKKLTSDDLLEKPEDVLKPLIREEAEKLLKDSNYIEEKVNYLISAKERKIAEHQAKINAVKAKAKEEGQDFDILQPKMAEIMQDKSLLPDEIFKNPDVNMYEYVYQLAKRITSNQTKEQIVKSELEAIEAKKKAGLETSGASGEKPKPVEKTPEDEILDSIMEARKELNILDGVVH